MGASYRPENPFARDSGGNRSYRPENPFAEQSPAPEERPSAYGAGWRQATDAAAERAKPRTENYNAGNRFLNALAPFIDEAQAASGALGDKLSGKGSFLASYIGRKRAEDQAKARFAAEHPKQNAAAAIGGMATQALATGGAAPIATAGQAARVAGTTAAANAFLEGEGGFKERAIDAGIAGGLGATAGAAVHGVVKGARALKSKLRPADPSAVVRDRMAMGGTSIDDAETAAREAAALGKPVTLADVGGQGAQRLARDASAYPTKAGSELAEFVEGRLVDQSERVADDLATAGNITKVSVTEAIEKLSQEQEQLAKPLYAMVENVPVQHPRLAELFQRPAVREAYAIAQKAAANRGQQLPDLSVYFPPASQSRAMVVASEATRGARMPRMSVGVLDQVKKGIDDMLDFGPRSPLDKGGMGPFSQASVKQARDALVRIADEATTMPNGKSLYAEARAVWGGPQDLMRQLDEGVKRFLSPNTNADEVAATMAKMRSDAAREAYRTGALEALTRRGEKVTTGNDAARWLNNKSMQRKLEVLLGSPEAVAQWTARFKLERGFGPTRNAITAGSRTTPMAIGAQQFAAPGFGAGVGFFADSEDPFGGAVKGAVAGFGARAIGRKAVDYGLNQLLQRGPAVAQRNAEAVNQLLAAGAGGSDELMRALAQLRASPARSAPRGATSRVQRGLGAVVGGR